MVDHISVGLGARTHWTGPTMRAGLAHALACAGLARTWARPCLGPTVPGLHAPVLGQSAHWAVHDYMLGASPSGQAALHRSPLACHWLLSPRASCHCFGSSFACNYSVRTLFGMILGSLDSIFHLGSHCGLNVGRILRHIS